MGASRAGRFGEGKRGLTLFRTFPFPKVVAFGLRFQNGLIRELGRVEVGLGKQLEGAVHGEDGGAEIDSSFLQHGRPAVPVHTLHSGNLLQ